MKAVQTSITYYLPYGSQLKVADGMRIKAGELLAEFPRTAFRLFDLAKILRLKRKKTSLYLRKKRGEVVEKGEVIASRKSFLGKEEAFLSPLAGRIAELDEKGVLKISYSLSKGKILAVVGGRVKIKGEGRALVCFKAYQLPLAKLILGPEMVAGRLEILKKETSFRDLDCQYANKILLYPDSIAEDFFNKAEALGVKALIVKEVGEELLNKIEKERQTIWFLNKKRSCGLGWLDSESLTAELKASQAGLSGVIEKKKKRLLIPV